ncbi:hypothetical protein WR25_24244 [Diploscapter pachys]|uniref:Uncharacterized protein n=1 Tax=Diploscapter pachys TaxID=2018661 RepID=A0A2A2K5A3_9BILA|nr:hypothetical protein WR25_24244 [Diploscapter pachys]
MTDRIDTLLGIAGANYGMCVCQFATMFPACGETSGFFPGSCAIAHCNATTVIPQCAKPKYGKMLKDINDNRQREAERIVSFYSEVIGKGNMVWGKHTSYIPHSDYKKIFSKLTHGQIKTETVKEQIQRKIPVINM